MLWNIDKIISWGDYQVAQIPNHPKAYKCNYILLHRAIMENHIGRLLTEDEIVHHKDGNKLNNHIDNLELMDKREHNKLHSSNGRTMVKLQCPNCDKEFIIDRRKSFLIRKNKYNFTCCSRSCGVSFIHKIRINGLDSVKDKIDRCLIEIFIDKNNIYENKDIVTPIKIYNVSSEEDKKVENILTNKCLISNKKVEIIPTGKCPICNKEIYNNRKYCSYECSNIGQRKVKRPSKEVLSKEIKKYNWCELGRKYGVSNVAVRKWAKRYEII